MYNTKLLRLFQCQKYEQLIIVCSNKKTQLMWYEYFLLGYSYLKTNNPKKAEIILKEAIENTDDNFQKCLLILVLINTTSVNYKENFEMLEVFKSQVRFKEQEYLINSYSALVESNIPYKRNKLNLYKIEYCLMLMNKALEIKDQFIQQVINNVVITATEKLMEYYIERGITNIERSIKNCIEYYNEVITKLYYKKSFNLLSDFQQQFRKYLIDQDFNGAIEKGKKILKNRI